MTERFAVIDTETTWANKLMSVGVAVADSKSFALTDKRYYILLPYKYHGAMYTDSLYTNGIVPDLEGSRRMVMKSLAGFLTENNVTKIFAYNAAFDYGQLPELQNFRWYDIMKIAGNKRYNAHIPHWAECYSTGKLKRGYGVENIYRLLSNNPIYAETHNALLDAIDELEIIKMLAANIETYDVAQLHITPAAQ
ncbi:MAG: hypothetical protein NC350_04110 [Corallococcus sp.]|nr:hypothetical protein [Corallococcus sp.]